MPHATACRALGVSQAWFYKWRHGDPSPQHARREQLKVAIRRLFAKHNLSGHQDGGDLRLMDVVLRDAWVATYEGPEHG